MTNDSARFFACDVIFVIEPDGSALLMPKLALASVV